MTPEKTLPQKIGTVWLDFWFAPPPPATLASMRIGVGLVLVYVLLMRSHDLETLLGSGGLGAAVGDGFLQGLPWRFSLFDLMEGSGWLWGVHVASITFAVAFLLGIVPTFSGALALIFHLSYGHRNPAVWLGIDGMLSLSLVYLILLPTGRAFAIPGMQLGGREGLRPNQPREEEPPPPWSGIVLRVMQIHLCLLYFQSALAKLNGGWLEGLALWHPRLVEKGSPLASETLQGAPFLLVVIPAGLVLFELFYGVFIWLRGFRHVTIACAVLVHLAVGVLWEKLPFNLLMIVLNLAFLKPKLPEFVFENLASMSIHAWNKAFIRE